MVAIRLEDLTPGVRVEGLAPSGAVTVIQVQWHGPAAVTVAYRDSRGQLHEETLFRDREPLLSLTEDDDHPQLDGDGALFRLASEARRIELGYLFDPFLAVSTSAVEPLPHQITAVYQEMLPRLPLRFLLADDPGAGKTIMTGLLIKELILRGDLRRCLVVCPGGLVLQWQMEMAEKFELEFEIYDRSLLQRSGNPFLRHDLLIVGMDQLARNRAAVEPFLNEATWDLVVVDEAHKMAAHYQGAKLEKTERYKIGEILGAPERTRHFLLLTATPHNGKDDDFYLFLSLLDGDRFEGLRREKRDVYIRDLMRRMSKEELVRFDGTPLFPLRFAHTASYRLSPPERELYDHVTEYVRRQMERAERLRQSGEERRGQVVGLALTVLQRRLASSPEAIYQTLVRRRDRLAEDLREAETLRRGRTGQASLPDVSLDEDEVVAEEQEVAEEEVATSATAATTVAELREEIAELERLVAEAEDVRQSREDSKWRELCRLIDEDPLLFTPDRERHKLIVFTEHRDTLLYLSDRIRNHLGRPTAVVTIHGGMSRDERKAVEEAFQRDPEVWILVATDAAGEGINLQRAHLVINYDLPWNPNRLEQRFGRVHRIGQDENCHMWSLLALETREADVFETLLKKLETERRTLPGYVFDVLGRVFEGQSLRDLLIAAIRRGADPRVAAEIRKKVEIQLDPDHVRQVYEREALAVAHMDPGLVEEVRERMQRAHALRLQPHFVASFFLEAFAHLGGRYREREPGRFELMHVPLEIRDRARDGRASGHLLPRYERVTFEPERRRLVHAPDALLLTPGHALFDTVVALILERHGGVLSRGAVLVAPNDWEEGVRVLWSIEHELRCGEGEGRTLSKRLLFLEQTADGDFRPGGPAPHLAYRAPTAAEQALIQSKLADWRAGLSLRSVLDYAVGELVRQHEEDVRPAHEARIRRVMEAVHERLTREIQHWYREAWRLREQEAAGKKTRLPASEAERRAVELEERERQRLAELEAERRVRSQPPRLAGVALVVPAGCLARLGQQEVPVHARETKRVEALAMAAVLSLERALGHQPRDVSRENRGYDVESRLPDGTLRFIEIKGRVAGADSVTVTRNEILCALNEPDRFVLALVEVDGEEARPPRYVERPFERDPGFGAESVTYRIRDLLAQGREAAGA